MDEQEKPAAKYAEQAEKRHAARGAEDYLKTMLKASQYIDNVAAVLETASNEMKDGSTYRELSQRRRENRQVSEAQSAIENQVQNIDEAAYRLREGMAQVEQLAKGSEGKLSSTTDIANLEFASGRVIRALKEIAEQRPTSNNGLSEDTIINAEAAKQVVQNKLSRIVKGDDKMDETLKQYNEDYARRVAIAQTKEKGTPAERKEKYKEKLITKAETFKATSRKLEERRTGVESFREEVDAQRALTDQSTTLAR